MFGIIRNMKIFEPEKIGFAVLVINSRYSDVKIVKDSLSQGQTIIQNLELFTVYFCQMVHQILKIFKISGSYYQ